MTQLPRETDVFVVGGGPAGLAVAIAAHEKGFRVLVADWSRAPIEKPCGEGLMPDSLVLLRRLGVTIGTECSFPFRGIRFLGDRTSVSASFPSGHGIGIRRTALHQLLVDRAAEAGVSLLWGTRVNGICAEGVVLEGQVVKSRWIIGADGLNSQVRCWAGLDGYRSDKHRYAYRRHYQIAPWTDCVEVYWDDACQFYITPINSSEVSVVVVSRDRRMRTDQALVRFPALRDRLRGAASDAERGAISVSRRFQNVARGRVALVGDASGSVDVITGEGLCLAFQQAVALGAALESGDLGAYDTAHRRLMRRPGTMANLMLFLDRFPRVRTRVLRAFAANPALFSALLAAHVGAPSPARLVVKAAFPLAGGC